MSDLDLWVHVVCFVSIPFIAWIVEKAREEE
jgi:hypothetical protein